jgi:CheY-like chemotaxis protein
MPSPVFVQVVGFRDVERHALNTVFRLSRDRAITYLLWTHDLPAPAHLALIDVDSYEGAMALASPDFNPYVKMICVGERAPESAWRVFSRPLDWHSVVGAMDELFMPLPAHGNGTDAPGLPPGVRLSLLVDESREHRLYLRARLALAGLVAVEDASTPEEGLALTQRKRYDLVIVNLDPSSENAWKIVDQMVALQPNIGAVVVTTQNMSWHIHGQAERAGCRGVLAIPFDPGQFLQIIKKV